MEQSNNETVQQFLDSFEQLSKVEKYEVAIEILHRTLNLDTLPLTEDELTLNAEAIFSSLDQEESLA